MSKQKKSALTRQVGGTHYEDYAIQPYVFFIENQIPHHKAAIIRRILRYDHKTGKGLEDLRKIQHELELIIELEGWEEWEESCRQERENGKEEEKECSGDCNNCKDQIHEFPYGCYGC